MISEPPVVTVLVPSYNHASFIKERVLSIINQSYKNFELIVIDDKSPDESGDILLELQNEYGFKYIRRTKNSGTPFAAWEDICRLASGKYIWVCESDDVAHNGFLDAAVKALNNNSEAVMFYCNSDFIDVDSQVIGNTYDYFHGTWKNDRWDNSFVTDGFEELREFQLIGQTVPNMSSALFRTDSFKKAYQPSLKKLKLTGDWLFVGRVIAQGKVIFDKRILSQFRHHEETARVRVKSAISQAEFIITKYHLFKLAKWPVKNFASVMGVDVIRHLYEPANGMGVLKAMLKISPIDTFKFALNFGVSIIKNPDLIKKYKSRRDHAKQWKIDNETTE